MSDNQEIPEAGVIAQCDQMEDGDQIWFPSRFEAEQVCDNDCCDIIPAPADYDGPLFHGEVSTADILPEGIIVTPAGKLVVEW